jgi:L-Ala-D/L-Glu epimerase / N-acetyl-D-glutamate racemase
LKIVSVETVIAEIPFRAPFTVWRGSVTSKAHVLVRITTDTGLVGAGEAAPFLYYAAESAAGIRAIITDCLTNDLVGRDPREIRAIMMAFEAVDGHHAAKAAVETALWDLLGKSLGAPIYRLIGGAVRTNVPLVVVLNTAKPAAMATEARHWVDRGFRRLKIKLGFGTDADEAAVAHVREAVGSAPEIRVDAEERYTTKEALVLSRRLERFRIELVSQPIPRTDWRGMRLLREALETPVLADECIFSAADVLRCIDEGAADMVNIKVLKCGGLLASLEMEGIARAGGLGVVVGSMIEAGVGSLLSAHFAAAAPAAFSAELCGPLLFTDDLLDRPLRISDGDLQLDDAPGLGAGLDAERLERYRVG